MKTQLAACALAIVLGLGTWGVEARAQVALPPAISELGAEVMVDPPQGVVVWPSSAPVVSVPAPEPGRVFPYSYYAAFPGPAREYVPYGNNDTFRYTGQAYGYPYDRWSWSYMSGENSLARYYYPPVR